MIRPRENGGGFIAASMPTHTMKTARVGAGFAILKHDELMVKGYFLQIITNMNIFLTLTECFRIQGRIQIGC